MLDKRTFGEKNIGGTFKRGEVRRVNSRFKDKENNNVDGRKQFIFEVKKMKNCKKM